MKVEYKHTLSIEIVTQFPENEDSLENLIQSVLGPWCLKASVTEMNVVSEEKK